MLEFTPGSPVSVERSSIKICGECGAASLRIIDSRPRTLLGQPVTRRRCRCDACGVRYTTLELRAEVVDRLLKVEAVFGQVAKALAGAA